MREGTHWWVIWVVALVLGNVVAWALTLPPMRKATVQDLRPIIERLDRIEKKLEGK